LDEIISRQAEDAVALTEGLADKESAATAKPCKELVGRIISRLDGVEGLERIWKRGLVHAGGPHYRLRGSAGPVSIGEDECCILGDLIVRFRPEKALLIGNGFGLSSSLVAAMMEGHGGRSVVTIDNRQEGEGERCFETAERLRVEMGSPILRHCLGRSPEDLSRVADGAMFDLVFIDGNHAHPHVTNDFRGVHPLLRESGIVCWHDYWLRGVAASVAEAERSGFQCLLIRSSCEMVLGTRDEAVFEDLRRLFPESERPVWQKRWLARVRLSVSYWQSRLAGR